MTVDPLDFSQEYESDCSSRCRAQFDRAQTYMILPEREDPSNQRSEIIKPGHEFLTAYMQQLRYVETDSLRLAGVTFKPDTTAGIFMVNPVNCGSMPIVPFAGMSVHEIGHIVKDHCFAEEAYTNRHLWGICCEVDVNDMVAELGYILPIGHVYRDHWREVSLREGGDGTFHPVTIQTLQNAFDMPWLPPGKSAPWYFNAIQDELERREAENDDNLPCPICSAPGPGKPESSPESSQGNDDENPEQEKTEDETGSPTETDEPADVAKDTRPGEEGNETHDEDCPCCQGEGEIPMRDLIDFLGEQLPHENWDRMQEYSPDLRDLMHRYAAQLLVRVAQENPGSLPGCMTADYDRAVEILRREPSWTEKLENWIGGIGQTQLVINRRRFNKRDNLGRGQLRPRLRIKKILDVSGSVPDEGFALFMGIAVELLEKHEIEAYIIECDTEIKDQYELSDIGIKDCYVRHGIGGTILTPAFQEFRRLEEEEEEEFAGTIVYTDGGLYKWPSPELVDDNTLWVIYDNKGFTLPSNLPGEVVYLDPEQHDKGRR